MKQYSRLSHTENLPGDQRNAEQFIPGKTIIPYAGRVFDQDEVTAAVGSTLDFWLTLGRHGEDFERRLANVLGVRKSLLVNSGSSANLLAVAALTSDKLGSRRLRAGDEVITVAAGFPTTVAPLVQHGLIPVFIDNDPITLNAKVEQLDDAYVPGKTRAVMMAHTLGNPFDLDAVTDFCKRHDLWLIEDNCDALGSTYNGQMTGSFGDLSTQSFYPPHHLTLGEGGAVNIVSDMKLKVLVESFRDWGRDCWCPSGQDNTCNKRFCWQLGELPEGYDHKYTYSHFGYNLKPLDIQAAIGVQQIQKLEAYTDARRQNWNYLREGLQPFEEHFEFQLPTHASKWTAGNFSWNESGNKSEPSWFGFLLKVKPNAPFSRTNLAVHLDNHKIGNRMLFGGNLVRQPMFIASKKRNPTSYRVPVGLCGADAIMESATFIGVYPGLTRKMLDYMVETIAKFVTSF